MAGFWVWHIRYAVAMVNNSFNSEQTELQVSGSSSRVKRSHSSSGGKVHLGDENVGPSHLEESGGKKDLKVG